jgi:hypothetical protein
MLGIRIAILSSNIGGEPMSGKPAWIKAAVVAGGAVLLLLAGAEAEAEVINRVPILKQSKGHWKRVGTINRLNFAPKRNRAHWGAHVPKSNGTLKRFTKRGFPYGNTVVLMDQPKVARSRAHDPKATIQRTAHKDDAVAIPYYGRLQDFSYHVSSASFVGLSKPLKDKSGIRLAVFRLRTRRAVPTKITVSNKSHKERARRYEIGAVTDTLTVSRGRVHVTSN